MNAVACAGCLRRAWLLARLSGHLDPVRTRLFALLGLDDEALIAAVGGRHADELRREHDAFEPTGLLAALAGVPAAASCRHAGAFPPALRELSVPPAALFLCGDSSLLVPQRSVAIIGSRRASPASVAHARDLAGRLAAAGVTIVSGLALGIDGAAHGGALRAGGSTVAVLPAGPDRSYPPSHRGLQRRIARDGLTLSELPPGSEVRRWAFPARNRLIAALSAATVVVAAGERSGALVTARLASELGRPVGAVPGRVGTAGAAGPHALIRGGATLVTDAEQVLELVQGAGELRAAPPALRPEPTGELGAVHQLVLSGRDTPAALAAAGIRADRALAALAALELAGYVVREAGGRYAPAL